MPSSANGGNLGTTTSTPITPGRLPLPVLQNPTSVSHRPKIKRFTRLVTLHVYWSKIKRRLFTGTAPSTSSLVGSNEDSNYTLKQKEILKEDNEELDEVIVERVWSDGVKSSVTNSDHGAGPEKPGSHEPVRRASLFLLSVLPLNFVSV